MDVSLELISTWALIIAALAGVAGALAAFWWQARLSRYSINLDFLWRLNQEFRYGPTMLKARSIVAAKLRDGETDPRLGDILDFFEILGLLVRRRALDLEMVHYYFAHWMIRYWFLSRGYVAQRRCELSRPILWKDAEILYDAMLKREARLCRHGDPSRCLPTQGDLDVFLREETL